MSEQRESPYGYNFYQTYRECPYKFWLKNYFGLIPNINRMELERGKIIHNLVHIALTQSPEAAYKEAQLSDDRMQFPNSTFVSVIKEWVNKRYNTTKQQLVDSETEHEIMFGPRDEQLKFTFRIDRRIIEDSRYGIVDTKVTGKSISNAADAFQRSNQFLAYKWACGIRFPEMLDPFVDIEIISITKRDGLIIEPIRIEYSQLEVWEWEAEIYGLVCEISQKVKAMEKYPRQILFGRNRSWTCSWCPYDELCMQDIRRCNIPEEKFHLEPRDPMIKQLAELNGGDHWLVNLHVI
jgi:hypothetical protein